MDRNQNEDVARHASSSRRFFTRDCTALLLATSPASVSLLSTTTTKTAKPLIAWLLSCVFLLGCRLRFSSSLISLVSLCLLMNGALLSLAVQATASIQSRAIGDFRLDYTVQDINNDSDPNELLSWSLGPQAIVNRGNNQVFSLRIVHKQEPEKILWQCMS